MPPVEKTNAARERLAEIVREIDRLPPTISPDALEGLLRLLVHATAATGAGIWLNQDNRLDRIAALNPGSLATDEPALRTLEQAVGESVAEGTTQFHSPESGGATVLIAPLSIETRPLGAVALCLPENMQQASRLRCLQLVEQLCARFAARTVAQDRSPPAAADWEAALLQLHQGVGLPEVTATAVNEGQRLWRADRVSLLLRRGSRYRLEAVSHLDEPNRRSDVAAAMRKVVERIMPTGEPFAYCGRRDAVPPVLERPLSDFVRVSGCRSALFLPLQEPVSPRDALEDEQDEEKRPGRRKPFLGCLVVEFLRSTPVEAELLTTTAPFASHIAAALAKARMFQSIWLLPVWRSIGRVVDRLRGRRLAIAASVVGAVLLLAFLMWLIPWPYYVHAEGRLMPTVRQQVFAPNDSEVIEVFVDGGEKVDKGAPLLQLKSDRLRGDIVELEGELNETRKSLFALAAELDEAVARADNEAETRLQGQLLQKRIERETLRTQLELLAKQEAELHITAPLAGTVATYQVQQLLDARPVQRGELLLEVMDETSPWQLELDIEEHRVGHVLEADMGQNGRLRVDYLLATHPEKRYPAELSELSTRATLNGEDGTIVPATAQLQTKEMPRRHIGAEVRARIDCGQRSLGYVLFGDLLEFLRKRFWL